MNLGNKDNSAEYADFGTFAWNQGRANTSDTNNPTKMKKIKAYLSSVTLE